MTELQFGEMTLTWIESSRAVLDAGPLFGPVVRDVWGRKFPNVDGKIQLDYDPILIQYKDKNFLIDAGFETSKLSDKAKRNLGIKENTHLSESLEKVGLTPEDIDGVLMTHMHNDHSNGLTKLVEGKLESVFPQAKIYLTEQEWENVTHPNPRTQNTYPKENWEPIADQFVLFDETLTVLPGIEMIKTGGHTNGLAAIKLTQGDEVLLHLSDIFQMTATNNPVWVTANDDYPMDALKLRFDWYREAFENNYKIFFYHDPYYAMVQYDETGENIIDSLQKDSPTYIAQGDFKPSGTNINRYDQGLLDNLYNY